jgi:hypothetical protein
VFPLWLLVKKQKTRDWLAIAGFIEILFSYIRSSPHEAKMAANARPNGHLSIGLRVLQIWSKRGLHTRQEERNTIPVCLSNFPGVKIPLSDSDAVLD